MPSDSLHPPGVREGTGLGLWVTVACLTSFVFGLWSTWTFYRQRGIEKETTGREIHGDLELGQVSAIAGSGSFPFSSPLQARNRNPSVPSSGVASADATNSMLQAPDPKRQA
jgi:hypothetical protein